ncbi:NAD-dependent epimerase/dehydratase family protein [Aquincola sp. S2]|uniref:NAD-dependent epimerase/dehydratase family protein n=1 Tax=Pseudaquabacterium terrae TaxID=2732868 RepID=A0ABX2EQD4_9BURK|nr:NAD-dependent epimerase/dehydratase family protein [Aquabacterium terrae]NRF70784.1 NAD-dependent epimerase/dehydratase family protein [Aquabacterium terrae]
MHVLVTGANGFVGRALAARLAAAGRLGDRALTRLSLLDMGFGDAPAREGLVHRHAGDLADAAMLDRALAGAPLDAVFHLASIPGGTAEADYALARRVNLDATLGLLERGRAQVLVGGAAPVFIFASSIAVFGPLSAPVTDDTLPRPQMTYGAQKLAGEILVDDFSRRGWVDGRSLRLPGVLARPPARTGQLSAFLSDIIRELAAGRPFVSPMSPQARTWASSLPNVVDNLLHAAVLDVMGQARRRTYTLPTSCFSMAELVDAIAQVHGADAVRRVRYEPDAAIEQRFGGFAPLHAQAALAAGFRADDSLVDLVRGALDGIGHPGAG